RPEAGRHGRTARAIRIRQTGEADQSGDQWHRHRALLDLSRARLQSAPAVIAFRLLHPCTRVPGMPLVPCLALAALLLASSSAIAFADELFDACAAAAASRFEPGYEGVGPVDAGAFYAYEAIDTCTAALEADPANVRVMA